jgi:23S rRNA pseudouridine2605 synthase
VGEPVRLQKYLSAAGIASRRQAERLMREGRVKVNGQLAAEPGLRIDPQQDRVEVDGRRVAPTAPVWVALHKPPGYVTTRRDPQRRPTVYDLLPPELHGLFHVGRLDAASEGLLLLTNQGDVAHRMLHPRYHLDRVYDVHVQGTVERTTLTRLRRGVQLEDGPARVHGIQVLKGAPPGHTLLRVTMREGRKREVRRLFETVGHPVRRLVRQRYGPVVLGRLGPGQWRPLSRREVEQLPGPAGADPSQPITPPWRDPQE